MLILSVLTCAWLVSLSVFGQSVPMINTVAGDGRVFRGWGGPAVNVALAGPNSLTTDGHGNLYFADEIYNVVGRIDSAGNVFRVADGGSFDRTGESADFQPGGIAADASGNVYVADQDNARIWKVSPDGTASLFAGCTCYGWGEGVPAKTTYLGGITGIALDAAGNLFVTDLYHHVVRKIDTQGNIQTVVGYVTSEWTQNPGFGGDGGPATQALLNGPNDVAFDSAGAMYIADKGNGRIRKVTPDGTISTFAGGGTALPSDGLAATVIQLVSPNSVATDYENNVVITDTWHHIVLRVSPAGIVKIVAGTTLGPGFSGDGGPAPNAQLAQPMAVRADPLGNVYIADYQNGRIRKVDGSGVITTVAGDGGTNYGGDGGLAGLALLDTPLGVAIDSQGDLFIADTGNNRVRKVDASGTITTVAGTGQPGYSGDGGNALAAALNGPASVAVDAKGDVYIADTKNQRVRKVDGNGVITTIAGSPSGGWYCGDGIPATMACLGVPHGVAIDSSGLLWIADAGDNRIWRVESDGTIRSVAGNGNAGYSGDGVPATSTSLWAPNVVLPDDRGGFFIGDTLSNRVRYVDAFGTIRTVAGIGEGGVNGATKATEAQVELPSGLALGRDGSLYISVGSQLVWRVTPDGQIHFFVGSGMGAASGFAGDGGPALGALLHNPSGLAMDSYGNLYVADSLNNRLRKITMNEHLVRRHLSRR